MVALTGSLEIVIDLEAGTLREFESPLNYFGVRCSRITSKSYPEKSLHTLLK
jgi:hypothetical protein